MKESKKVQRLAHKAIFVLIIFFFNPSFAQEKIEKRERAVLESIIVDYNQVYKKDLYLSEIAIPWEAILTRFYEFKFEGILHSKEVLGVVNDTIIYETDYDKNKKLEENMHKSYKSLDLYFSKSDIKKAMDDTEEKKWEAKDFKNLIIYKIKSRFQVTPEEGTVHSLSKPLFSANKKFMVIYFVNRFSNHLVFFELKNENWVRIDTIVNFF